MPGRLASPRHHEAAGRRDDGGGAGLRWCDNEQFTFEGQNTKLEKSFFPVRVKGAVLEVGSQGNQGEKLHDNVDSETQERQRDTTHVLPQMELEFKHLLNKQLSYRGHIVVNMYRSYTIDVS